MPEHLDVLIERLKKFDEVTLLELLDLSSEDIVERFTDVIDAKRDYLFGEIEELPTSVDDGEEDDFSEGFQMEDYDSYDD